MRGCLTLLVGIAVGVAIMAFSWPTIPAGSTLPGSSDVRVSLGNGYLTRIVQARLSTNGIVSIHGLQVRSAPPALVVRADASLGPLSAPITVELQPLAAGGDVQVRIVATHIGVVPVPNVLTGLVTGSINDSLRHTLGSNATVTGVTATQRGLDITANYP
jgi:hypothetical protein